MKKYVLCVGCGKKIHIDELGVINNQDFCHNNLGCLAVMLEKTRQAPEIQTKKEKVM